MIEQVTGNEYETFEGAPTGLPLGQSLPTTAGCRGLVGNRPRRNAPVLDTLLAAGALVLAKANMHELAMGITNNNGSYGAVRNPYDPQLIPGGSSGGTAAGIAARVIGEHGALIPREKLFA